MCRLYTTFVSAENSWAALLANIRMEFGMGV